MADGTPFDWNKYAPGDQFVARTATAAELVTNPDRNPYYGREARFYAIVLYHGAQWQTRAVQTGSFMIMPEYLQPDWIQGKRHYLTGTQRKLVTIC